MELTTRRHMLRLAGASASGLAAGTLLDQDSVADAATSQRIRARLGHATYRRGQRMILRIRDDRRPGRRIRVTDSSGTTWRRVSRSRTKQVWTATAKRTGTVRVIGLWDDGRVVHNRRYRDTVRYQVSGASGAAALIGMSAPAEVWGQRVGEVGAGVAARRIFADLAAGPSSQLRLVQEAHAAGMLPVVSYKVGGDVAGAVSGRYNAVAEEAAARLASFGLPTAVTFWHEPFGDMSGAEYVAASRQLLPIFRRGELRVGPVLNGWLLDNQVETFGSFCPDEMFGLWDWVGIDTYESGTMRQPGAIKPAQRIPALSAYVRSRGFDLPLGVGEYNGYSAQSIGDAGEALLTTPNVWFGCLWNSTGGKGVALSGERLVAFQQTLADPRRGAARSPA